jgi:hypothetical protein
MSRTLNARFARFAITCLAFTGAAGFFCGSASAGVLPEDEADLLYFRYDGGGVQVQGPSMLVRKSIGDHVSVEASYLVDMVSSASIDVETSASPYDDERIQYGFSATFLQGKSSYTVGYSNSTESDYVAKTTFASVAHDMFGDLTTVSFSFSQGNNDVFRNLKDADGHKANDPAFHQTLDTKNYSVGVSQIITKNLILSGQYEVITDEGWTNSPYRSVRFFIGTDQQGQQPEVYPNTRTSNSTSIRAKYFLPYRAAIDGMYRFYTDTWGVIGHTAELGYVHPLKNAFIGGNWIFEGRFRYYTQTAADFYADIFPRADYSNFMARDKELGTYTAMTAGLVATYEFKIDRFPWLNKGQLNLRYDYMAVDYDDFRDARYSLGSFGTLPDEPLAPGTEPLYKLRANIYQFYISAFF